METPLDEMVARLNIRHFRTLLTTESDEVKRATLFRLLAEEEWKLAAMRSACHANRSPTTLFDAEDPI